MKVIKPHKKSSPLDSVDYIRFGITGIAIGWGSAILTVIGPIWVLIGFIYILTGGRRGVNRDKKIESFLKTNWFQTTVKFFAENFWTILIITVAFFMIRYFYQLYRKKFIYAVEVDKVNEKISVTFQKLFGPVCKVSCSKHEIQGFDFKSSSGLLGHSLKIKFSINGEFIVINTNSSPWSMRDEKKILYIKKFLTGS